MRITASGVARERIDEILMKHLPLCTHKDARLRLSLALAHFMADEIYDAEEVAFNRAVDEESAAVEDAKCAQVIEIRSLVEKCLCDPCKREVALEFEIRGLTT